MGDKETFVVQPGGGSTIKDMKPILAKITKYTSDSDEIQKLYKVMFNRRAKKAVVKKHIKEFSGATWGMGKDDRKEKIEAICAKWNLEFVKKMLDILKVDRTKAGGDVTKGALVTRLIEWLEKPEYVKPEKKPKEKKEKKKPVAKKAKKPAAAKKPKEKKEKKPAGEAKTAGKKRKAEDGEKAEKPAKEKKEKKPAAKKKKTETKKPAASKKKAAAAKEDKKEEAAEASAAAGDE